jgi:hypothetical protein
MRLRTWVVVVVVAAVIVTVGVATTSTDEGARDRISHRASIDLTGACRTPTIVVGGRVWATAERAPDGHHGVVDGTLWVTGEEGLFVAEEGGISLRYALADDTTVIPPDCVIGG